MPEEALEDSQKGLRGGSLGSAYGLSLPSIAGVIQKGVSMMILLSYAMEGGVTGEA